MDLTHYPTALDLRHFLEITQATVPTALVRFLEVQINGAREDIEGHSGCDRVFLAPASETRYFDPPTARDRTLRVDVVSASAVNYQPTGSSAVAQTLYTDYWLEPRNNPAKGLPYTAVRFARSWQEPLAGAEYASVQITGRFGYGLTLPSNVFLAILSQAALKVYQAGRAGSTGNILTWKEGDLAVEYGVAPTQNLIAQWQSEVASVIGQYRRLSL